MYAGALDSASSKGHSCEIGGLTLLVKIGPNKIKYIFSNKQSLI